MNFLVKFSESKAFKELSEEKKKQIKELAVDFLFRFKDKHSYSSPDGEEPNETFYKIMDFLDNNSFEPSEKLREEYMNSETTKALNELLPFEFLKTKIGIKREIYNILEQRYSSKPSFIYFFNPNKKIQIITGTSSRGNKYIGIGFLNKEKNCLVGAGTKIFEIGGLEQGYYKESRLEYYGRIFYPNGDFYIGTWRQHKFQGKGEYEYKDGSKEVGCWKNGKKDGKLKYYDKNGNEEDRFYKNDKAI